MEVDRVLKNVINQSVRVKILRRFISELPFYLFDYFFIAISLIANLIKYKLPYKKDLVIVTGSDNYFATSLFQLLDNINLNLEIKAVVVYDLGMKKNQVQKLKDNYKNIDYRKFNFNDYPQFFEQRDEYGKLGAYAWKPAIIWEVISEYKCQVVWLDTGNLINQKFRYVRIILSNLGFFSPISAGKVTDYTHESTLKNLKFPEKFQNKRMLTGGFACFDWENESSRNLLYDWKNTSQIKSLIIPNGSNPNNHKWDQSLLTVFAYMSKQYLYLPKIKSVFGIKVNQNPGRYFYLVEGSVNSIASKVRNEWYKNYKTISTLTIRDSKIIWVTSLSQIGKVKLKMLKQKKVILTIFEDESKVFNLNSNNLKIKRRINYIDFFFTTNETVIKNLDDVHKKAFLLKSEDLENINTTLLKTFNL